jgi:hypothetical protein
MKRLFDDPALPAELRADLLRSRRAGHAYDPLAKLPQLRSALSDPSRHVDDSSGPANDTLRETSRLTWSRLQLAPWPWKLAVLLAITGSGLFAVWPAERPAAVERPVLAKPLPSVAVETHTEPAAQAPAPSVDAPVQPMAAQRPAARSSRREIAQLERIRALLEQDPAAAYRLARRSEREFPDGLLSEERRALWILAQLKTGAVEAARRDAREFFARYPESPLRELVESALPP